MWIVHADGAQVNRVSFCGQGLLKVKNFRPDVAARSVLCDEAVSSPGSTGDCFGKERLAVTVYSVKDEFIPE